MENLRQAIKDAFTAGYSSTHHSLASDNGTDYTNRILLDIEFWKALGVAKSWREVHTPHIGHRVHYACTSDCDGWEGAMHRFIDHISAGKEIDLFFKDLI